jgi:hypothetical protein
MNDFDCDDCGGECDDVYQFDNGNTFVCEDCYTRREG